MLPDQQIGCSPDVYVRATFGTCCYDALSFPKRRRQCVSTSNGKMKYPRVGIAVSRSFSCVIMRSLSVPLSSRMRNYATPSSRKRRTLSRPRSGQQSLLERGEGGRNAGFESSAGAGDTQAELVAAFRDPGAEIYAEAQSSPRVAANPSRLRPYRRPQQPTSHFVPRIDVPQDPNPRHDETGLALPLRGSTLGYFLIGATGKHART